MGRLQFCGRGMGWRGFAMEEAVGQRSADALVEENEQEGDSGLFRETVGVRLSVALE